MSSLLYSTLNIVRLTLYNIAYYRICYYIYHLYALIAQRLMDSNNEYNTSAAAVAEGLPYSRTGIGTYVIGTRVLL